MIVYSVINRQCLYYLGFIHDLESLIDKFYVPLYMYSCYCSFVMPLHFCCAHLHMYSFYWSFVMPLHFCCAHVHMYSYYWSFVMPLHFCCAHLHMYSYYWSFVMPLHFCCAHLHMYSYLLEFCYAFAFFFAVHCYICIALIAVLLCLHNFAVHSYYV